MLFQQTQEQLRALKLHGMAAGNESQRDNTALQALGFDERFGMLVEAEVHDRRQRRQARLLRAAKLKEPNACPEDIDYGTRRGLDRSLVASLLDCEWITRGQHLIVTGPTGVGKTWLACAFGQQAARKGLTVSYRRLVRLLEDAEVARGDGSLPKLRTQLANTKLVILDDWAVAPISVRGRQDLLEFVEDRSGSGSLVITSQLPVDQWHDYIGEPTLADAILDRIVHRAHRIVLKGDSMRKRHAV